MQIIQGHIEPFWKDQYKHISYTRNPFGNSNDIAKWVHLGYVAKHYTGEMHIVKESTATWELPFFKIFSGLHTGVTLYRMETSVIMPEHFDTFEFFIKRYNITDCSKIRRALIFLEDWQSGHIFEINNSSITGWKAGDYVIWDHTTPHLAANIGINMRYTAQVTYLNV